MEIKETCKFCSQDSTACSYCNLTGEYVRWKISPPKNVFHSYKVLEVIDVTEYNALSNIKKEGIKLLLSCGFIDLNEDKASRARLWDWFGAESITIASLTALLT